MPFITHTWLMENCRRLSLTQVLSYWRIVYFTALLVTLTGLHKPKVTMNIMTACLAWI